MILSIIGKAALALTAIATANASIDAPSRQVKVRQIAQLVNGTWLENVAIRANGQILGTRVDQPLIMSFDPLTGSYSTIARIPRATALFGIVEFEKDVFGVIGGNFTLKGVSAVKGSYSIYKLDFNSRGYAPGNRAEVSILAHLPEAEAANGLTFSAPNTLYASDTYAGVVYKVDTKTGALRIVANHSLLQPPSGIPFGVNGVRFAPKDKTLYFANTGKDIVGRFPVAADGSLGEPSVIASNPLGPSISGYDDFAVSDGPYGAIYATTNYGNTINRITKDGKSQSVLAGSLNSSKIAGATSAAFGRTSADKNILYAVTSGDLLSSGPIKVGAQVVALDLSAYESLGKTDVAREW